MPKYQRSAKDLMHDFAKEELKQGQLFTKSDAVRWFSIHYPKLKSNGVALNVEGMAVNSKERKHHSHIRAGRGWDLFFKLPKGQFRLWDEKTDPAPLYPDDFISAKTTGAEDRVPTVPILTIHEQIKKLKPKQIALITQLLRETTRKEDGEDVSEYHPRQTEQIFKNGMLQQGINCIAISERELDQYSPDFQKNGTFDLCIITGDPFYQLFSLASRVRKLKYRGPLFLEITEEEANKTSSLRIAEKTAIRYGMEECLSQLVYLSKARKQPREIEFQAATPPSARPKPIPKHPSLGNR